MSIDQHVSVNVTVNNAGLSKQGFGTIAHVSYKTAKFGDAHSLTYDRYADIIADGFAATSPEALFVQRVLGQTPHPRTVKLIKGTRPPTQKYELDATNILSSYKYQLKVKGEGVTTTTAEYTSDASATQEEIHNGLLAALNAVVGKNYTCAFSPLVYADAVFTADNATEQFTIAAHGLQTGDGPFQVSNGGGALPAGLAAATDYWIIRVDANTFKLATSLALALAGTNLLIGDDGTGVQTLSDTVTTVRPQDPLIVTADAAGNWFSIEVVNTSVMQIEQTHVDPGIATDLAEIVIQDNDWYYLDTTYNSEAMVLAAAAAIEAMPFKMYMFDSNDSPIENTAAPGADVGAQITALTYKRVLPAYHRKPNEMWAAGWMGVIAAMDVGKWTSAYKTVAGATPDKFSATQITNLDAKKVSYYKTEAGRNITWKGWIGNTSYAWFNTTVELDFVMDLIQKKAFGVLVAVAKVGYTDEDLAMLRGAIEGAIDICKSDDHKIVAPGTPGDVDDPVPTVVVPKVKDIPAEERAAGNLPDVNVSFRLQGAVLTVDVDLTVSF
jgi:hypothetical protein